MLPHARQSPSPLPPPGLHDPAPGQRERKCSYSYSYCCCCSLQNVVKGVWQLESKGSGMFAIEVAELIPHQRH